MAVLKRLTILDLDSLDVESTLHTEIAGNLPYLKKLHDASVRVRSDWPSAYLAENVNTAYLTGCKPETTGFWSFYEYDPKTARVSYHPQYDFSEYPVFYRYLAPGRVTSFDLPQLKPDPRVPGVQVTDWGTHGPRDASKSIPEDLFDTLVERFGASELLGKDALNLTDPYSMEKLLKLFPVTLARRAAITREMQLISGPFFFS